MTIATSTLISAFNSLTLSPALAAVLLRPHEKGRYEVLPRVVYALLGGWAGYIWLLPWLLPWLTSLGCRVCWNGHSPGLGRGHALRPRTRLLAWWLAAVVAVMAGAIAGRLLAGC